MTKTRHNATKPTKLSDDILTTVRGGTETARNVKNFDKPIRDYYG